jgi:uncharacterized protein YecE (DUF72 family)
MLLLGTSGWSYNDWVGNFYPAGTKPSGMLRAYAAQLSTVEIDSTFYGIPRESAVRRWEAETPEHFVFSAKVPQLITHERQLVDCVSDLHAFADRMRLLGGKLGPLLLQFPYSFRADAMPALEAFLPSLPRDLRFALEVRHRSWLRQPFYDMLVAHNVALALIDHPWMPKLDVVTADFLYVRWLGDRKAFPDTFTHERMDREADLLRWKEILERAAQGLVAYGYFNNHYAGHSPSTLKRFSELILAS